jgi:thioredoxin-dependent peroxiredoxin
VGDTAPDFTLKALGGDSVRLATIREKRPVDLVVLRGWPGYQCPICTRQVGELNGKSSEIAASKAQVVLVYPGPAEGLRAHVDEFARSKTLPDNFHIVLTPEAGSRLPRSADRAKIEDVLQTLGRVAK